MKPRAKIISSVSEAGRSWGYVCQSRTAPGGWFDSGARWEKRAWAVQAAKENGYSLAKVPEGGMKPTWGCSGVVRGSCGVAHRSFKAALACCAKDFKAVTKGLWSGSLNQTYSDRAPYPIDGWDATAEAEREAAFGSWNQSR